MFLLQPLTESIPAGAVCGTLRGYDDYAAAIRQDPQHLGDEALVNIGGVEVCSKGSILTTA